MKKYLELDLGYFDRNRFSNKCDKGNGKSEEEVEFSPDCFDRIKVIFLGASAVGKTSIIQQFVWKNFTPSHHPTTQKQTYYPSVIMNHQRYEIKITDLPTLPYFPIDSSYEWSEYRFYNLRDAAAYVLVFDLANSDTFDYVRTIRAQIRESKKAMKEVPVIIVVGNKRDSIGEFDGNLVIRSEVEDEWGCVYVESCAKSSQSVNEIFKRLIGELNGDRRGEMGGFDRAKGGFDGGVERSRCVVV